MIRRIDCDNCHTSGLVECTRCGGEGVDSKGNICNRCGGSGLDGCPVCKGKGYVEVEVDDQYANMGW